MRPSRRTSSLAVVVRQTIAARARVTDAAQRAHVTASMSRDADATAATEAADDGDALDAIDLAALVQRARATAPVANEHQARAPRSP